MSNTNLSTTKGPIPYRMTNDYMFRAVFQTRPKALEGLCRSLLHLSPEDTVSITIQNPIELGKTIDSKDFVLDLALLINNSRFLNLEMQVYRDPFWRERSISYAARSYDNLTVGEQYSQILPVHHIGFLSYTLFPEYPEFFATYKLLNEKNMCVYSDKFLISVIDLNQIELATEEDKAYGIDLWARVFNATTWEEIDMLAQDNPYLQDTVVGIRELTDDEKIRMQCEARRSNEFWERMRENYYQQKEEEFKTVLADMNSAIADKERELASKAAELADRDAALADKDAALADKDAALADKEAKLADRDAALADKDAALADRDAALADKEAALADKDAYIAELEAKLKQLNN